MALKSEARRNLQIERIQRARSRSNEIHAEEAAELREIGAIPDVLEPARRERCRKSLRLFIEEYIRTEDKFALDWSPDHLKIIARMEQAIMRGGLFALAMPRGSGKTSICERAAIWAVLYGYRRFVVIIGDGEAAASESLDTVKMELASNRKLLEDFPEVCFPIAKMENVIQRCRTQTCGGKRTGMTWGCGQIVLPTVDGSKASGAVIQSVGITGRVRGMKYSTHDGTDIRPDFVLIDDPQNDESANSPEQNKKRLGILNGAILGLSGPGVKISGVMPCTVIKPGDMADTILDAAKSPDWNGERCKMLKEFPANMELWNKYNEIREDSLRERHDISLATEFYRDHRDEMDRGALAGWEERYQPDEISAVQNAMNLFFRNKEAFYAEYQNEPLPDDVGEDNITCEEVWKKMDGRKRGEIPVEAEHLVAFIDVQGRLLYYTVMAFADDFTSWLVDCNAFPRQKRRYFTLADANPSFETEYPGMGIEGQVYNALNDCIAFLTSQGWKRADGMVMPVEKIAIDSGWGNSTSTVYKICRENPNSAILHASKGKGLTAAQRPMTEYRREPGMKIGFNWLLRRAKSTSGIRLLEYDTNFWKSFYRQRLFTARGDKGSMDIFGNSVEDTRLVAEMLSSETATSTFGNGRRVDIWKLTPGRDNHWLDGVVGCHVLASICGCDIEAVREVAAAVRKEVAQKYAAIPQKFLKR